MQKDEVRQLWQQEDDVVGDVLAKSMQSYWDSLSDRGLAVELSDRGIRCMDEGTPGGVRLAGSGILLGLDRAERFARRVMADGGVSFVSYHRDCGAAGAYTAEHGGETFDNAKSFAEKLAERLGVEACEVKLERPEGFHIARAIHYDTTGSFDPSRVAGMPAGFVISAKYHDEVDALAELDMAISIAMGSHGFGDLFDREHPLLLVPVAANASQLNQTTARISQHLDKLAKPKRERIRVDSLMVGSSDRWLPTSYGAGSGPPPDARHNNVRGVDIFAVASYDMSWRTFGLFDLTLSK